MPTLNRPNLHKIKILRGLVHELSVTTASVCERVVLRECDSEDTPDHDQEHAERILIRLDTVLEDTVADLDLLIGRLA